MKKVCAQYNIRSIEEVKDLKDKVALLRVDFNVPIDEKCFIVDDFRIRSTTNTINFLLERDATVILMSHLGEPSGFDQNLSFKSIINQIETILSCKIELIGGKSLDEIGELFVKLRLEQDNQKLFMLDNIRFFEGEKSNDDDFAQDLIKQLQVDLYVNDGFSVSHRCHSSIVAIPSLIKEKFAGFSMINEVEMLESTLGSAFNSNKKITAIIGGKKVKSKLLLLKTLESKVDKLVIVGGMANTFLKARGVDIGNSFYEPDMVSLASEIHDCILPIDFMDEGCKVTEDLIGKAAYDIGPKSLELIDSIISKSELIIWNGPAGVYEDERFAFGSNSIGKSIIKHNIQAVVGGGDTLAVINKLDTTSNISISSGGGAFIAWLEDHKLPGIKALKY